MTSSSVDAATAEIISHYPNDMRGRGECDAPRHSWHTQMTLGMAPAAGSAVCDVGGGLSLYAPVLARLGYRVTVVDDFRNEANDLWDADVLPLFDRLGITVVSRDVVADGLDFPAATFDVIASFEALEHWHHSPKRMLHQAIAALKPGGYLFIGTPNCVNLRKRITVPLGRGKWSPLTEWYDKPVFRSHVREPDVEDLRYIARDLGLVDVQILGRNWHGLSNKRRWVRALTPYVDRLLRRRPSLCSNLYLLARKP